MARHLRVGLSVAGLAIALVVPGYVAWTFWDMHRLRSFCNEVHPGTPVKEISLIATRRGIDRRWLEREGNGIFDDSTKTWGLMIPAPSQMGDMACSIKHNGVVVTAAEVIGP